MRSKNNLSAALLVFSFCFSAVVFGANPTMTNLGKSHMIFGGCMAEEDFFIEEVHVSFYSGEECGYVCIDGTMEWDGNNYSYDLTFSSDNCSTFTVSGRMDDTGLPPVKGNDFRTSAIAVYQLSR